MKRGQLAIEFIMLVAMSIVILFVILIITNNLTQRKIDEKTYYELDDLAKSIQTELIRASEVEDGYERNLDIPETINGRDYNLTSGNTTVSLGYVLLEYRGTPIYYIVPALNDSLRKGPNLIRKQNGSLVII